MEREVAAIWGPAERRIESLMAICEAVPAGRLNWRPPAEGANSLYALATHTLANLERNVLGTLSGREVSADRAEEFAASADGATQLRQRWEELRDRCANDLEALTASQLDGRVRHPNRGEITRRDMLLVVLRHAAEHEGQAQLTRDLALAADRRQTV